MELMHFQVVDQNRLSLLNYWKGADPTITDHLGRHSLQCLAFGKGVFEDGEIGMGVDVNKTRGGHEAVCFDDLFPSTFDRRRDLRDHSVLDGNIPSERLSIRAVDYQCTPDEECKHTNNFAISFKDVKQKFS